MAARGYTTREIGNGKCIVPIGLINWHTPTAKALGFYTSTVRSVGRVTALLTTPAESGSP